jgi:hypothetical protein
MTQDGTHPLSDVPDHGRKLEFGYFLDPPADEPWAALDTAHFALDLGFDTFILRADNNERTLSTFITDVAPALRQQVAEARALSPGKTLRERRRLS